MDLKQVEVTKAKSSIEEPPELELKDLPSHLEYAYLEGTDKLPVIIAKSLKDDEKEALLKVLKSHKRAIAWKITDIKGIDPRFCTHKILMEEDYKPAVQSQRRVNQKIHEVIKKEVIKLLDAGMIYPISDSPWGFAAALAVLVTGASQSRQHESHHRFFPVDTSLIHIESRKSPTKSLFDVGSRRISIFTVNTKEYHSDVLEIITRIMRRT
ncbi:hypothetical protein Tco_0066806 [Tanacetum coccineum]